MESPTLAHGVRLLWALLLIAVFVVIEISGAFRKYKIRPDSRPSRDSIRMQFGETVRNMFLFHMVPVMMLEVGARVTGPSTFWEVHIPKVAPSLPSIALATFIYMLCFDLGTFGFHYLSHTRGVKFFFREHHVHHANTTVDVYAWNGYWASPFEGFAGLVFFELSFWPVVWLGLSDPLTRTLAIAIFQFYANLSHSGYDFPFEFHNLLPGGAWLWHGSIGHFYHHKLARYNMAVFFSAFDVLAGTHYNHMANSTPKENIFAKVSALTH